MKQSGRQWNETTIKHLKENGFIQLISEPCVFKKVKNGKISCIVGLYIDDMTITGNDNNIKETIKAIIYKYKNFKM